MERTQEYTGKTYSFWELLDRHHIRIPEIQRDYVQGRDDLQATLARHEMLGDIREHLEHRETMDPMSLNFIYGEVDERRDGKTDANCYPLDGQQRLTTLYVLHWLAFVNYLSAKVVNGEDMESCPELDTYAKRLSKFSYMTRPTSTDFFDVLSDSEKMAEVAEWLSFRRASEKFSDYLKNKNWFRPDFNFDPTIQSVLVVLDELDGMRFLTDPKIWESLIGEDCPIVFEWLDIRNVGNGDDLYIKMNGRGRQLSDFENLKAELEGRAQQMLDEDAYCSFVENFDQKWMDYFWNLGATNGIHDREHYDVRFMNLLNWYLWNQWAVNIPETSITTSYTGAKGVSLSDTRYRELAVYDMDMPEGHSTCDADALNRLALLLNAVTATDAQTPVLTGGVRQIVNEVSDTDAKKVNTDKRMMLEVAVAYLAGMDALGQEPSDESWSSWIRVFGHLSKAAAMWHGYDNLGLYANAVKAVEQYVAHAADLTAHLGTFPDISGFTPTDQMQEEQLKAKLRMIDEPDWGTRLARAESIPYFEGKIGFLFDFIGLSGESTSEEIHNQDTLEQFDSYVSLFEILYPDQLDTNLLIELRKALLTQGDFSTHVKSIRSYLVDSGDYARDIGWRNLLRKSSRDDNRNGLLTWMPMVLDDVLNHLDGEQPTPENVARQLHDIVEEGKNHWDDTRTDVQGKLLVEHPELWDKKYFGNLWQYRMNYDGICYLPNHRNRVLSGLNYDLDMCLIERMLKENAPSLDVNLLQIKGTVEDGVKMLFACNGRKAIAVGRSYETRSSDGRPAIVIYTTEQPVDSAFAAKELDDGLWIEANVCDDADEAVGIITMMMTQ
ncbi:DUF262 domain-containing protein [Bifidobacterium pseudolongum]|uniref:DUF262 domain-containing protein n=1 Tax=Bifidobacterium pseudolongum TaxID=1694 RepID=UPI001F598794|nr:DUF262 domain-containing protein [Bifidobacterium pseudolongum]